MQAKIPRRMVDAPKENFSRFHRRLTRKERVLVSGIVGSVNSILIGLSALPTLGSVLPAMAAGAIGGIILGTIVYHTVE